MTDDTKPRRHNASYLTPLQAAFAQMRARQPHPKRLPPFKITLYANADLTSFHAVCNQVGGGEYDTPEDALTHALTGHTRFFAPTRTFPVQLKAALTSYHTKKRRRRKSPGGK